MADKSNAQPIIIKKKKKGGGDGHHGGAWKVAYADFVTAMMAFFMLMWLLNATTEQQRKGLADYFSPSIPIARVSGGGDGALGGDSVFSEEVLSHDGTGASDRQPTESDAARGVSGAESSEDAAAEAAAAAAEEEETLLQIAAQMQATGGDAVLSDIALSHVHTRLTDEGLVIEIFSRPGAALFDANGRPAPWLPDLATAMVSLFGTVINDIAVEGHIAAEPVVVASETRWQGSTRRAQTMRGLLEDGGLPPRRIVRVTGHADREPVTANPMAARNDRIEVILLRQTR